MVFHKEKEVIQIGSYFVMQMQVPNYLKRETVSARTKRTALGRILKVAKRKPFQSVS